MKICTRKTKYPPVHASSHNPVAVPTEGFYIVMDARCSEALMASRRRRPCLTKAGAILQQSGELALTEARRLSEEHGLPYVVLQSVALFEPSSSNKVFSQLSP